MKATILEPSGYCSGVNHAINVALTARKNHPDKPVYVNGMLVHNEEVISFLFEKGIITLKDSSELVNLPDNSVLIFTAHGHPIHLENIAKDKHLIVYDAICPKVQSNIDLIKKAIKDNRQIIYIGVKNHPETEAALSIGGSVFLFDIHDDFDFSLLSCKNPIVINQTTLNFLEIKKIHDIIKKKIPDAEIIDEVCSATRKRQESVLKIPQNTDLIIVVGDSKSSNSKRLFEIAKDSHKNSQVIIIAKENELDLSLIKDKKSIVIASGASTPKTTIDAIYQKISNIKE